MRTLTKAQTQRELQISINETHRGLKIFTGSNKKCFFCSRTCGPDFHGKPSQAKFDDNHEENKFDLMPSQLET